MTARNLSVCKASGGFPCISADCMKRARDGTRTRGKTLITVGNTGFPIFSWANMTKKENPRTALTPCEGNGEGIK